MNEHRMTYTAPAVIACTEVVQGTKDVGIPPNDGATTGNQLSPGSVGFSL